MNLEQNDGLRELRIRPCGDRAVTITLSEEINVRTNLLVQALSEKILLAADGAVTETVPSYSALVVLYDPAQISYNRLCSLIRELFSSCMEQEKARARLLHIPCCYQARFGPDLAETAALLDLSAQDLVRLHCAVDYRIFMIGFLPGFPYLGGMDQRIAAPRLKSPRQIIPAGSVGIGGSQTGIYPVASPGGWRLIGQTPLKLYDPSASDPILCRAGDYIRFEPVTTCDFYDIRRDLEKGIFKVQTEEILCPSL